MTESVDPAPAICDTRCLSSDPHGRVESRWSPPHRGWLAGLLALLMIVSAPGPAFARAKKKKHPKHTPAAHHVTPSDSTPADAEKAAEPETEAAEPEPGQADKTEKTDKGDNSEAGEADRQTHGPSEAAEESAPTRPASRHPSKDSEAEGENETDDTASASGSRPPPALRGGVGFGAVYRQLTWTGAHPSTLVNDSTSSAPELGGWLEIYPGAFVDRGFAANVGAILSFNRGFGISSKSASGFNSDVIFQDFLVGVKMRFPLGFFVPHVSAAYGGRVFKFSPTIAEVPSVFYAFARLAAGLRAQIADAVDAEVEAAYLAVVDTGSQSGYIGAPEYFPGLGAYGLEAGGSIGVRVTGAFGLRAGVDFQRFALDLSHATGMLMANQATDQYLTIWGGLEVVLDGASGGAGGTKARPESRPPAPPIDSATD